MAPGELCQQPRESAASGGFNTRSTRTIWAVPARSATASSICGSRSRIDNDSTSRRNGTSSALTGAGSTSQLVISATKLLARSWNPTSTPPFFTT